MPVACSVCMLPQLASSSSSSMHRTASLFLIVIRTTSFFASAALQPQNHHGRGCVPAERAALLSFKKGITNDRTNLLGSWLGEDCCSWRGVKCSKRTGHVIKLHLRNTNPDDDDSYYYGTCPDANALFGDISPSLLSLKHLENMDLSMNCLLGLNGRIPDFLGSMVNMRYLNLSGIPFTGRVPSQLGNLSKLQYLDLGQTGFSEMYSTDITWLTKLPLLQYLSMRYVNLSGIVDWPCTLNMIPSLRVISLPGCSLDNTSQSLPYFNLTKLEKLDLSGNDLRRSVASDWFWKVRSLKYLSLRENGLSGQFPSALGNMTSLQVLDLSANYLYKAGNLKNLCSLEILHLNRNEINGYITQLMGGLPQCAWEKLQELHLGENNFIGTLPNLIVNYTSLRILELNTNNLVGLIPKEFGNLKRLTTLDLHSNQLNGNVPTEIGAVTTLTSLDISNNNLTGSIPAELEKLRYLTDLYLSHNKMTGTVPPKVMHLTSLAAVDLSSNHLNGSVPVEIGSLNNLVILDLSDNNFSGVITEKHFAGLKSLKTIDLSSNNLKIVVDSDWLPPFRLQAASFASCQMGPLFPAWLQRLETTVLDISSTSLKGEIPDWFWSTFSQAEYLSISNNQISGSLPAHLDGMACEELYLGSNRLTGPIPSLLGNITVLDISNNTFSGTLPSNLEASQLQMLLVYSNRIVGYIPESICKLQQLSYLDLSNNILEGEIPQCSHIRNIQFLLLGNNSLSGKFPAFLQNNTDLEFLDLAWNKFFGRLPAWIGELGNLRFLLLAHNTLSGNIPAQITNLGYLQCLDLSGNNLSGAIPWHLSNLTFMAKLQKEFMPMGDGMIGINNITAGAITAGAGHLGEIFSVNTKGEQLIYGRTLAYFFSIDLSGNCLTGEIPTDITSLASLLNLNLSSNQLSGQIPRMIGAMLSLVSLDLSKNKISGEIPSTLSNLSSLSYLNLSYNNLSGRIPPGRQLDTLNVDNPSLMYIGNRGLCGPPLQKNCSGNVTVIHGHYGGSKQEFEPMTFYFGLVLGVVAGHWMVFCAMLFKKTWRVAFFRFFDKLYDMIYVFVVVNWARFMKNTSVEYVGV